MLNPKSGRALAAILIAMFGIAVVASVVWGVTWLLAVLVAAIAVIAFFAAESSQPTSTARQQSTATPPRYGPPPPPPPPPPARVQCALCDGTGKRPLTLANDGGIWLARCAICFGTGSLNRFDG